MNTGIHNNKDIYADPRELIMVILKHGADVEVISPKSLREAVTQHIRTALARYQ